VSNQRVPGQLLSKPWLVTGGAGYIGGHVIRALTEARIPWILLDIDLESAKAKFSDIEKFEKCDIRDVNSLKEVFVKHSFEGVIHLAALKSVEDSQSRQQEYFETNVIGTRNILDVMNEFGTTKIIFSSSAAVYQAGEETALVDESSPLGPVSFYGQTKVEAEEAIQHQSHKSNVNSMVFRYFNVAGALDSTLRDKSKQNLIPITIYKLKSKLPPEIFGNDYETADGTAIRDYVDVRDIANAHLKAIAYFSYNSKSHILNIGTGKGASVSEVIELTQEIMGTSILPLIKSRRPGDISAIAADCKKAREIIGFSSNYSLREMIETSI
jgi:UDP-glucose 4-epimerase